jgi:hypothetical protein
MTTDVIRAARQQPSPDERKLGAISAARLAGLSGLDAAELEGETVAALSQRLRWAVDPEFFLFAYVCGQVVTNDPATGKNVPVPYATVEIVNTVCDCWGYFPEPWPFGWLYPVHGVREVLGTVTTDECGNFCFWVPRFDLEWIRRWRLERVCFEQIFVKPTIGDLLARAAGQGNPDPGPLASRLRPGGDLAATLGPISSTLLSAARAAGGFGDSTRAVSSLLNLPAFPAGLTPPLPARAAEGSNTTARIAEGPSVAAPAAIDPGRYIGPFLRCVDLIVPEWYLFLAVPDISLTITQGSQTIYEGAFDIAWGSSPIPPVTIQASPIATGSALCSGPGVDGEEPGFQYVGLLPVSAPYASGGTYEASTGIATRVNQPQPPHVTCTCDVTDLTVTPTCPADAPFSGELYLYGGTLAGASYYRIAAEYAADPGLPSAPSTFTPTGYLLGTWTVPTPSGDVYIAPSDPTNGWYEIPADETGWGGYTNMLMAWGGMADGVYRLTLEFADAARNPLGTTPPQLRLVINNAAPTPTPFQLRWQPTDASFTIDPTAWQSLYPAPAGACPIVHRAGQPIAIEVTVGASSPYLYEAWVSPDSCASGAGLTINSWSSAQGPSWVYTAAGESSYAFTGVYALPATAPAGCYGFTMFAATSAFNSAGGFASDPVENGWCVVDTPNYVEPSVSFAVVD